MRLFTIFSLFRIILIMGVTNSAMAMVTLPSFFTDNMVLQQKSRVPFWGKSNNATVKVITSWDSKSYSAKVVNGIWRINFTTPSFGGPYTITINDEDKLVLEDILIGEVWLCSGQSNMEMPLDGWGKIKNYSEEMRNANYPQIRLLQTEQIDSSLPLNDLKVQNGGWQICSPTSIGEFSATAYFFARKIYEEKHIPIGLIHSSWGGTMVEAWTSAGALNTIHDFDAVLKGMVSESGKAELHKLYDGKMKIWNAKLEKSDKGMQGSNPLWAAGNFNDFYWRRMQLPGYWEFSGLEDFDGVVWFRKTIDLSESFTGKDVMLECYVDDDDKIWVNGTYIGSTDGYNVKRHYTIPANLLKKGENTITIRVFDGSGSGGVYGSPEDFFLKSGSSKMSLAGDWKYAIGLDKLELPAQPYLPQGQNRPSALYNAMIYPLLKYKIAGVIWYQGENNAERAQQYQTLFPLIINDWRAKFDNKKLPFYFVQLANFRQIKDQPGPSDWAELREAQFKTLALPNTGMAVITDIGDAQNIHPKNKQEVGERLARIALAKNYGVKIAYSGPMYVSYKKSGKAITLKFKHNEGLKAAGSSILNGFSIAGEDRIFYWAEAIVDEGKVIVSSLKVPDPIAVRYNWADNPQGNLTNEAGLPASAFRTDAWPGITDGKK